MRYWIKKNLSFKYFLNSDLNFGDLELKILRITLGLTSFFLCIDLEYISRLYLLLQETSFFKSYEILTYGKILFFFHFKNLFFNFIFSLSFVCSIFLIFGIFKKISLAYLLLFFSSNFSYFYIFLSAPFRVFFIFATIYFILLFLKNKKTKTSPLISFYYLQLSLLYGLSVYFKMTPYWIKDFSAVKNSVMTNYQLPFIRTLIVNIPDFIFKGLTIATLGLEIIIPLFLLFFLHFLKKESLVAKTFFTTVFIFHFSHLLLLDLFIFPFLMIGLWIPVVISFYKEKKPIQHYPLTAPIKFISSFLFCCVLVQFFLILTCTSHIISHRIEKFNSFIGFHQYWPMFSYTKDQNYNYFIFINNINKKNTLKKKINISSYQTSSDFNFFKYMSKDGRRENFISNLCYALMSKNKIKNLKSLHFVKINREKLITEKVLNDPLSSKKMISVDCKTYKIL